ncbi:YpbS family protein [Bacillus sonorensis]|uniref:YpbS family protein n=1 Tax=Bacillus sonorensis TaxID=119858 RepID=UPI0004980912|nr:YpbS family protein [Bacillus sonorensis]MCF7618126.1 YpbS family protein [Bacillus sonorensis]MCY7856846.1 YpbS family protein [Bacillus sonorensis]MCY8024405.1 YpbS family protein [Bacillus sonorensis]MCY8036000.1 YpbS family protein [Bacillus sonorensis]MCY8089557.1 YpbS family protein [Bacillus sonorensis]
MTNVHEAITAHSKKQHQLIKEFVLLEQERERAIEEAVATCERQEPFSTDRINQVTAKMNELAKKGIVPQRRFVTKEMVEEYVSRKNAQA